MEPSKPFSVVAALRANELGIPKNNYRHNLKIMSNIVKQPDVTFKKIWSKTARKPIVFDDNKIFFDGYRECYALCGINCEPTKLYQLDLKGRKRIVDAIVYTSPVHKTPLPRSDFRPFILCVTEDNWLLRFDNKTGKLLQEVFLGVEFKFRHIEWETHGETLFLQSVEQPRSKVLRVMAFLKIYPMTYVGAFVVDKEVITVYSRLFSKCAQQVFGNEIRSANLSEGLVIVGTGTGLNRAVRLYGLCDVITESNFVCHCTINEWCDHSDNECAERMLIGVEGIRVNIKIRERPPLLFEIRCSEEIVFFGGYPWHYIYSPPKQKGVFHLKNLKTHAIAENGTFDMENTSTEPDTLTFHVDDTGRLVYTSANEITFYKLCRVSDVVSVVKQFSLSVELSENTEPISTIANSPELYTPRRRVQRKKNYAEDLTDRSILTDDYENELEFYLLLGRDKGVKKHNGRILIFDNVTGQEVKKVDASINLHDESEYTLIMDMDRLVLIAKDIIRFTWTIHVYKLTSVDDPSLHQSKAKYRQKNKC